jgi:hypothetical protein
MLALMLILLHMTPSERIARGETALEQLEYETAALELMLAATDPNATDAEKLRANLLAGVAHRVLGRDLEARINFRYVLLRAPDTKLEGDTSPKVTLFYESVRQEIEAERINRAAPEPAAQRTPPAAEEKSFPVVGAVVTGVGVVTLLGSATSLAFAETALGDPARLADERAALQSVGQWSTGAMALGAVVAVVGGALIALGGDS